MSNHLHLIVSAKNHDLSDLLRDFKKYTSKQIIKAIEENKQESRREWMLEIFRKEGAKNSRNKNYQFWRQDNQPQELYSAHFVFQKINYIHNNPVEAGIVANQEHYLTTALRIIFILRSAVYWMWFLFKLFIVTASLRAMLRCKRSITTL